MIEDSLWDTQKTPIKNSVYISLPTTIKARKNSRKVKPNYLLKTELAGIMLTSVSITKNVRLAFGFTEERARKSFMPPLMKLTISGPLKNYFSNSVVFKIKTMTVSTVGSMMYGFIGEEETYQNTLTTKMSSKKLLKIQKAPNPLSLNQFKSMLRLMLEKLVSLDLDTLILRAKLCSKFPLIRLDSLENMDSVSGLSSVGKDWILDCIMRKQVY